MANNRRPNMFIIFIMFIITYYNNLIRKNRNIRHRVYR